MANRSILIEYTGGQITNSELYTEAFELTESLCATEQLDYSSIEASEITFKSKIGDSLKGKWLTVSAIIDGVTTQLGRYKVESDKPDESRDWRTVVAYDAMKDILEADVATWYKGLTFPMTLKAFRNSFFSHLGISQETTTLANDSATVKKTLDVQQLTGKTVISAICEINGVFGHIGPLGTFQYISLNSSQTSATISPNVRTDVVYEDFICPSLSKVQIRTEAGDIGASSGSGTNAYIVTGNFLTWDKGTTERTTLATNLKNHIQGIPYTPCEITSVTDLTIKLGDKITTTTTKGVTITSYVLKRQLKGVVAMRDTYTARGVESRQEKEAGVADDIQRLNAKANVLTRTIEETRSELYDENGNSIISQMASQVVLKVDSNGNLVEMALSSSEEGSQFHVKSQNIDLTADEAMTLLSGGTLDLTAKEVTINSTNFSVTEDGTILAKAGDIAGWKIADDQFYKEFDGTEAKLLGYMQFFHPTIETDGDFTLKIHSPNNIETTNEYGRLIQAKIDDSAFDYIYIGYDGQAKFGEVYIRGGWDAKENTVIRYPHIHTYFKTAIDDYRPGFYLGEDGLFIQKSELNEDGTPNYGNETGSFICDFEEDFAYIGSTLRVDGDIECDRVFAGDYAVLTHGNVVTSTLDIGENTEMPDRVLLYFVYEE